MIAIAFPAVYRELQLEAHFYQRVFQLHQIKGLVFDIGANLGFTTQAFLDAGAERVVAVDPDAYNIAVLKEKFQRNPRVTILRAAASKAEGEVQIWQHQKDSALHTLEPRWKEVLGAHLYTTAVTVRAITLDNMVREFGMPDFLKIDVEGHEWMALQGLSGAPRLLSFELNLPEYREEGIACVRRLEQLNPAYHFKCISDFDWETHPWAAREQAIAFISQAKPGCYEVFCNLIN